MIPFNTHIVVARYNEDIRWLLPLKQNLYIYNKGDDFEPDIQSIIDSTGIHLEKLPNVGREQHTFIHHFLKFYDSPPDFIITLQAKVDDHIQHNILISKLFNYNPSSNICNAALNDILPLNTALSFNLSSWNNQSLHPSPISMSHLIFNEIFYNKSFLPVGWAGLLSFNGSLIRNRSKDFWITQYNRLAEHNAPEFAHFMERVLRVCLEFNSEH
jgi:hypothetical protein